MSAIQDNLCTVRQQINEACARAGRPANSVQLLAVSKTFASDTVLDAAAAGQRSFGENYIQEAVEKITTLRELRVNGQALEWHCIGPVQSNKTRMVAEHFDWLHTLDRLKTAERLSEQRPPQLEPLQVCIQVNVAPTANKAGVEPEAALELVRAVMRLPRLQLRGLMCIPDAIEHDGQLNLIAMQALFERVTLLHAQIGRDLGLDPAWWDTRSMGMSGDLGAAVAGGSTMVRVGSAIFGSRPKTSANEGL